MNLRTPNGPSRTGGRMEERSHPVKPNANDYRSIALGKGDRSPVGAGHGGHDGIVRYPAESPSVHSMSSSVAESPMNPLLSNQVLSNAAFLFSPSYVGSDGASLQRVQANRDSTFSISTFASRARLSTVSSRSRPVVTIPVSSSWSMKSGQQQHGSSVAYASAEDYEDGGIGASGRYSEGDDDGVRHLISKHVRFSDTGEDKPGPTEGTKPIDKPHQSGSDRSSLFRSGPVVEVHSMGIETKISDLTDQSSLWSGMGRQGRGDGAHSLPKHDAEIENDDTNQGRNVDMNFLSSRTVNAFGRLSLDEEEGNDDDDSVLTPRSVTAPGEVTPENTEPLDQQDPAEPVSPDTDVPPTPVGESKTTIRTAGGGTKGTGLFRAMATTPSSLPKKSPFLRFKRAQKRFANPPKAVPVSQKTPPKKFSGRSPKNTLVSNRIVEIQNRIRRHSNVFRQSSSRQLQESSRGYGYGHKTLHMSHTEETVSDDDASTVVGQSRNPQGVTYQLYEHQQQQQHRQHQQSYGFQQGAGRVVVQQHEEESAFARPQDDSEPNPAGSEEGAVGNLDVNQGPSIRYTVADDSIEHTARNGLNQTYDGESIVTDDSTDDPFATIMMATSGGDDSTAASTIVRRRWTGHSSARSSAGSSLVTDALSKDEVSANSIFKSARGGQVNPQTQRLHGVGATSEETPGGARKWRALAAAARQREQNTMHGESRLGERLTAYY